MYSKRLLFSFLFHPFCCPGHWRGFQFRAIPMNAAVPVLVLSFWCGESHLEMVTHSLCECSAYWWQTVSVRSDRWNRCRGWDGFQHRQVLLHFQRLGSPRPWCQQVWFLVRAHFLPCRHRLLTVSSWRERSLSSSSNRNYILNTTSFFFPSC